MRYKTLFRLLLKVLGIWFFLNGIYVFLPSAIRLFLETAPTGGIVGWTWQDTYSLLRLSGPALYAAAGLYLFFGGKWIVDKAIPSNRPYCHECGYDLTATVNNRCPECGTPFRPEDVMPGGSNETQADSPDESSRGNS